MRHELANAHSVTLPASLMNIFDRHPDKKSKTQYIFYFDEGSGKDQALLGYKGASLCELKRLGVNVPPGFILSSDLCKLFYQQEIPQLPFNLVDVCVDAVCELERLTGQKFDPFSLKSEVSVPAPLLLSIRCASSVDIPGLTATVLNVGMNEEIAKLLARQSKNLRWAYDTYRRFIQTFGVHVLGIDECEFEKVLSDTRSRRGVLSNNLLNASDLIYTVERFKVIADVPDDPWLQLTLTINAMLKSWISKRSEKFRDVHNIPFTLGSAVVVQSMVFGNLNVRSGVGIMHTRNTITGDKEMSGHLTRISVGEQGLSDSDMRKSLAELSVEQSEVHRELQRLSRKLEAHFRDVQTVDFTIEDGKLFVLETRRAERSPIAALRFATALVNERVLNEKEALMSIDVALIAQFVFPMIDPKFQAAPQYQDFIIGQAQASYGGVVSGIAVMKSEDVQKRSTAFQTILCKDHLNWHDEAAVKIAKGVLVGRGYPCSFEYEMARSYRKCLVTGLNDAKIQLQDQEREGCLDANSVAEGDTITIDGSSGLILRGVVPTINPLVNKEFQTVIHWAERYKSCLVKCIGSTLEDIEHAVDLGAEGIGIFSMDGLFEAPDCIGLFRRLILSSNPEMRSQSERDLVQILQQHLSELYLAMQAKRLVVSLVNGPLSSFFPQQHCSDFESKIAEISCSVGESIDDVRRFLAVRADVNPLLGFRGGRLNVVMSELMRVQARAITGAALSVGSQGIAVAPCVVIPGVTGCEELERIRNAVHNFSQEILHSTSNAMDVRIHFGAVIELPRACLQVDRIMKSGCVDFLWFDTDRLTELVFGVSFCDQHIFMTKYQQKGIVAKSPFKSLDQIAVGKLLTSAIEKCKEIKPSAKIGIVGRHCTDSVSVDFFVKLGVDILICPNAQDIPAAKLAAAQGRIGRVPGPCGAHSIDPSRFWEV